jgi:hypothetical protein
MYPRDGNGTTIDDLLADSLIQTVMRADRVEPQALKTLLNGVAGRIAARRREVAPRHAGLVFVNPAGDQRNRPRETEAPHAIRRRGRVRGGECGLALCR